MLYNILYGKLHQVQILVQYSKFDQYMSIAIQYLIFLPQLNSTWIDEKCSYNATCKADKNGGRRITKRGIRCHKAAECKLGQGIWSCRCKSGYYGNGLICKSKEYIYNLRYLSLLLNYNNHSPVES